MGLLHHDRLLIGYDLGEKNCQVSYSMTEDYSVETLSCVAGEEAYNIPTVLCKRTGVNQWYYGREALRCAQAGEGILVDDLVRLALDGEQVRIDGTEYDPVALLALFVKRSMSGLAKISSPEKLYALMITCENTDRRMIEVLNQVVGKLNLKTDRVFFQSHSESFFYYMLHQPEELWKYQSLLLEYRDGKILSYCMECNQRTRPVVAYMHTREFAMAPYEPMPEAETLRREKMQRLDDEFCGIAEEVCNSGRIASVYLIGEYYSDEWLKESLRYLCRGRRVFQGNNLFSKGACLAVLERVMPSDAGKAHVFLGDDKLKVNIGMDVLRRGEKSYLALLDAGVNWFESDKTVEFYVQDCSELEIRVTSLIGSDSRVLQLPLGNLPEGSGRLRAHLYMNSESSLLAEIEDLGLGNLRPATQRVWKQEWEI